MSSKKRIRAETVCFEYVSAGGGSQGLEAVRDLGASETVLRAAMVELKRRGKEYAHLENWCIQEYGFGLDKRKSNAMQIGETRTYTVQDWRNKLYLKLPLDTLENIEKGSRVDVKALSGRRIEITVPE